MSVVQPFLGDPPAHDSITILTWRVAAGFRAPVLPLTIKRQGWVRYGQAQGAYRATLRLLRRAISAELNGVDPTVSLANTSRTATEVFELHPYVLAYLLLRFAFERTRTWRFDWCSDLAAISDEPIAIGKIGERLSRRCVRAIVLGAYVGMLNLVKRTRARGEVSLGAFCVDIDELVFHCIDRYGGVDYGFVIFPKVSWLPTRGLRTDRSSVLCSVERLILATSDATVID
ncbi:hypothetical protein OKW43_008509 [Paraburkholderia sp. WC7.3g]